jgi:hypothetical protein
LRRPASVGEGARDHGEAGEHKDDRKPDMSDGEDGAVNEAFERPRLLAQMIGHEHGLAVAGHQRMDRAEQNRSRHSQKNCARIAAGNRA